MRKTFVASALVVGLALASCYGGFNLSRSLYGWNSKIENKWGRWGTFLAFVVIPVYPVCLIGDFLVLNSIEFWSGDNPVHVDADGKARRVVKANGEEAAMVYDSATDTIEIQHDGKAVTLRRVAPDRVEVTREGRAETWRIQSGAEGPTLVGPGGETFVIPRRFARP